MVAVVKTLESKSDLGLFLKCPGLWNDCQTQFTKVLLLKVWQWD